MLEYKNDIHLLQFKNPHKKTYGPLYSPYLHRDKQLIVKLIIQCLDSRYKITYLNLLYYWNNQKLLSIEILE